MHLAVKRRGEVDDFLDRTMAEAAKLSPPVAAARKGRKEERRIARGN